MVRIDFDSTRCVGCDLCVELCPKEVFVSGENDSTIPKTVAVDKCCACMTCAGKCPHGSITIHQQGPVKRYLDDENDRPFVPLSEVDARHYADYAETLEQVLKLRNKPVAITLIPKGEPLPHIPLPQTSLRYCQSLMMARRGMSVLMPETSHACPDGGSILGLGKVPPKLASGDIYVQFGKLASREAAAQMVAERPALPEESIHATLVTPLAKAVMKPDVVAVIAPPETMMWLLMASTYFTGKRSTLHMSAYNAQCVETTLLPMTSGELNTSLGCYGCRAISDVGDDLMFMGIPLEKMPSLLEGLELLGKKTIGDSRDKIYLPPLV